MAITTGLALNLQAAMNDVAGKNSPELIRDDTGYINALQSSENTSGIEKIVQPRDGKKRDVRIIGLARGIESDIVTTGASCADTAIERAPYEETVSITTQVSTKPLLFDASQIRKLTEGTAEWKAKVINAEMNALAVKLNKLALAQQAVNFGAWLDETEVAPKGVTLITTDNRPEYFGEAIMMEDYSDIGGVGRPMVIGAGKLALYARMTGIGTDNAGGLDMGKAGQFSFYRDRFAGAIFGDADEFALLAPGAVQLITWNQNEGEFRKANDMFMHDTIIDPFTGIKYDLNMVYDPCPEVQSWKVWLSVYYKVHFLPVDKIFQTGDDLEGVNFTLNYKANQAVVTP